MVCMEIYFYLCHIFCLDMFGRLRYTLLTIAFLLIGSTTTWADKTFVLVIDPGHGGHDAGAVGSFSKEKEINLQVALAFGSLVEQNCPDVKVIYTRKTDIFIPLDTRADIANNAKADLFISVHTNSLPAGRIAYGSETYTLGMARAGANLEVAKRENSVITYEKDYQSRYQGFDPNKAESYVIFEFMQDKFMRQSVDLARCIQKHYVRANRKDKGVHQAGFLVLRKTSMPAVLTELGFISTPEEESFLNSKEGIKTLSTAIYNGFIDYRKQHGYAGKTLPPPIFSNYSATETTPKEDTSVVQVVPVETNNAPIVAPRQKENAETTAISEKENAKAAENTPAKPSNKETVTARKEPTQPKPRKEEKQVTTAKPSPTAKTPTGPSYTIQFAATSTEVSLKDPIFRGMEDLKCTKRGNLYIYTTGHYNSKAEAEKDAKKLPARYKSYLIVKENDLAASAQSATKAEKQPSTKKAEKAEPAKEQNKLTFRVQFATTPTKLSTTDARFKGLPDVRCYHEGKLYKYTSGNYASQAEARSALKELQKKYPDAFIVKFQGNEKK